MIRSTRLALLPVALAVCLAFPTVARAGVNEDILNELKALKSRVAELEKKLEAQDAKIAETPQGMTVEQQQDFNRIAVKTEAMEDARDALGLKNLKISGYMDPTFIYNQRQDRAGFQFLNRVDTANGGDGYNYDNSYFGAAVIDFTKETDGGSRWRLTLAPNRGVGSVFDGNSPIHEASVSIPLTDLQTRLIAGQIPDWSGYEYLQPTLNKLITHNLLFDFTLPTAYTGAGLEVTRGKWLTKVMLANVNASKRGASETSPGVAYRVDYAKGEFQGFGFAGVHGKAANFTENVLDINGDPVAQRDSRIDLFELDAYFIRGDWTVQGQWSIGRQAKAAISPDPVSGDLRASQWWGLSALAAYKFEPRLEGTVRADFINNRKNGGGLLGYTANDDRNGLGVADTNADGVIDVLDDTEHGVNRSALTFGLSYLYNLNTTFKFEYRFDHASGPVFLDAKDGSYKKNNQLIGASVLVSF
ncbi:DUF3138 family protein [Aquabacterium sp. CECT 9606]|uniref:DUF3138 family protein n=1 Tax=Aquabacterium sp. CECT 9606 TaxID=2845822 RepID=UPI001E2B29D8|nr:DUF3138 family protein [Aquabacterium sp. CECT 9606]CAH0350849.1 hypothetical protein AQB9606_01776 [Aquabacterium sp. CECT 9606]